MSRLLLMCALLALLVSFVPGVALPPPVNDISYGDYHPALLFDWYPPAASTGHDPALLFIHGGQPPYGDKKSVLTDYPQLLELARINGIGVFSAEFRPYPEYTYPSQLHDVQLALQFLRENAATYGLDPQRIGVWGHSAGGIMGGWMSYGADAADPLGTPVQQQSSRPNLFLAVSCITDFTLLVPWFTGSFFGEDFLGQVDPLLLQETSATWQICNVPREFTPPVYSLFGQTYNLPPLVDAHDAYFGEALHKALRACEPEVEKLSMFEIRDEPLAEISREQLKWMMVCFGMEGPAKHPQKQ